MATWPGTLPTAPLLDGYTETPPDTTIRTASDTGPNKIRRRFTAGVRKFMVRTLLTTAQVATLDTLYITTLEGGALPFDWTHPRTGASVSFRFVGPPVYSAVTYGYYNATMSLEIMP